EARGPVGGGDDVTADRLRQGPQEGGDELVAHAGNLPVEPLGGDLREEGQRDDDADAVVGRARLEPVGEGEHLVALTPAGGEVALVGARRLVEQVGLGHVEELRRARRGVAPPRLERADVEDVAWDACVVEREDRLVADEDVAATLPLLELLEAAAQLEIAALESGEALVEVLT